ncbi:MAG: SPOR domain-containing protein [Treponema sp.]|nr:SPOR domain-containing protein [Treponema sp.]
MPAKIIGKIPDWDSTKLYEIQAGAFRNIQNADNAYYRLIIEGLNPTKEKYLDFTRVIQKGITAREVMGYLAKIKHAGFNEVIIREDSTRNSIAEKWEITTAGSAFASLEFNHDYNYIAIENNYERSTHFGIYEIPEKNTIKMDDLGIIRIGNNDESGVSFSFSPIDDPETVVNYEAEKAALFTGSPELDLFCRTWRVVNCTDEDYIDCYLFISNAGTYFFKHPSGYSESLSQWRWYDDKREEFEYSHDNWEHYGRAKINELKIESLILYDPGYNSFIPGYSLADMNYHWELVPANYSE